MISDINNFYEIILDNIIEGVFTADQNDIIYYLNEGSTIIKLILYEISTTKQVK